MKREKLILISNDDGYNAKGIAALIEVAAKFGRVVVVAPKYAQSGMSQAITMYAPLYPDKIETTLPAELYSLNGTPVDCVKFALDHLLKDETVDLMLSGVNHGSNAATNVLYSGTMGAAIEGSFYAPAIGFSLLDHSADADFEPAKPFIKRIIRSVIEADVKPHFCLNVNIPALPTNQIKGIKCCRQTRGYWREEFFERVDPRNKKYYWLTGEFINHEPEAADTDEYCLAEGYVSIVPVQVDLTDYQRLEEIKKLDI
ncbi:MAG: 5'/3'-nucleotidase SurE [Rikenellaceae bacterium]